MEFLFKWIHIVRGSYSCIRCLFRALRAIRSTLEPLNTQRFLDVVHLYNFSVYLAFTNYSKQQTQTFYGRAWNTLAWTKYALAASVKRNKLNLHLIRNNSPGEYCIYAIYVHTVAEGGFYIRKKLDFLQTEAIQGFWLLKPSCLPGLFLYIYTWYL